jgi:hypothetical protein
LFFQFTGMRCRNFHNASLCTATLHKVKAVEIPRLTTEATKRCRVDRQIGEHLSPQHIQGRGTSHFSISFPRQRLHIGQTKMKRRSLARFTFNRDAAAMLLHNVLDDAQA